MKDRLKTVLMAVGAAAATVASSAKANEVVARKVDVDVAAIGAGDAAWSRVSEVSVALMAQPMVAPRSKTTMTDAVKVQAAHDGKWIAFRLKWKDADASEAGKLGEFSDAVAIQFPVNPGPPPPIFMGAKDNPVHIYHWRAQYARDERKGMPSMKDIYPNMNVDMYPLEPKDPGNVSGITEAMRTAYSHGQAAGNSQSFKKSGVDEILAEGFSTTAVIERPISASESEWKDGEWTVVIKRALKQPDGSVLEPGKSSHIAFAVWQGGRDEVGSRKSVTMAWTPVQVKE